jgi:glycosyltransferase involved in cell wall biosynthesis
MSGLVACQLKRAFGVPVVTTFHALGRVRRRFQGAADGFPDSRFAIEERVIEGSDRVIAQCPQDEIDLLTLYGADPGRLTRIPCGYDPAECHPVVQAEARARLGLPADAPLVLQLGRLVPRKGVDDVIRAFARVRRGPLPEARLLVVGGDSREPDPAASPEMARLMAVATEENVTDGVIFAGRRDRAELADHYSAADVFVTMPWYEPFGITPVEAMACGTPVIGARVGGIQHSVRDGVTGFLVPPRDVEALAERLLAVLQDETLRRRLGAAGIVRAREHFTWQHVVARFADLFAGISAVGAETVGRRPAALDRPGRDGADTPRLPSDRPLAGTVGGVSEVQA